MPTKGHFSLYLIGTEKFTHHFAGGSDPAKMKIPPPCKEYGAGMKLPVKIRHKFGPGMGSHCLALSQLGDV